MLSECFRLFITIFLVILPFLSQSYHNEAISLEDCANCIYILQPQLSWLRKHKETKIIYMLRLVVGSFTKQTSF